jgi:hypothetical protein
LFQKLNSKVKRRTTFWRQNTSNPICKDICRSGSQPEITQPNRKVRKSLFLSLQSNHILLLVFSHSLSLSANVSLESRAHSTKQKKVFNFWEMQNQLFKARFDRLVDLIIVESAKRDLKVTKCTTHTTVKVIGVDLK